jgi:hypothetical protein
MSGLDDIDDIKVFGDTNVGWCPLTLPNETVDDIGSPFVQVEGFSAADPRAPKRRVYDDPEVCALREHLRTHNGIPSLEILQAHEIERAARIPPFSTALVVAGSPASPCSHRCK